MGKVVSLEGKKATTLEKKAKDRERTERLRLTEVNAYVNHNAQSRVTAGLTHSKTMQHGVDLRWAIAKFSKLTLVHKFHPKRFEWAISELDVAGDDGSHRRQGILLVRMPRDVVLVLSCWHDHLIPLSEFEEKVIEMSVDGKIGRWESV